MNSLGARVGGLSVHECRYEAHLGRVCCGIRTERTLTHTRTLRFYANCVVNEMQMASRLVVCGVPLWFVCYFVSACGLCLLYLVYLLVRLIVSLYDC